jgi:signal transduction histidine kinase
MNIRHLILLAVIALFGTGSVKADDDYKNDPKYIELRDAMHHAFNDADSVRFYPAVKNLEDYLLQQGDLHAYYTQRCNEIVFLMNRQRIFEAYTLGRKLSTELREKKIDKEMYMAYNILGHINRYCGNKAAARRIFRKVIDMMEEAGYYENMPPIYMNLVNVEMEENPEEAMRLLDKAKEIAEQYSPDRVFDIETRKYITYYTQGDIKKFQEGYEAYRKGVAEGKSSVHGRSIEVYYLASLGKTDEAIALAKEELGDEAKSAITEILAKAGRWEEAYKTLKEATTSSDSINNVVLINSMRSISDQLRLEEMEKETARNSLIAMGVGLLLLGLLVAALTYIVFNRRKHLKELRVAYDHALESDRLKSAFIQNVSHEVRTPLNIISGFSQIIADPEMAEDSEERRHMSKMMQMNCHKITSLIDEMLELSHSEASEEAVKEDHVEVNDMLRDLMQENQSFANQDTQLKFETTLSDDFILTTNEVMLKRAVGTLVDNAIKNTERGTITLKASALGASQLILAVEDSGSGIPDDEAEHIFERFVKLDAFKEGLGLGLPLCRTLLRRLGGTVLLDRTFKGPGARFVISLPIEGRD